MTNPTYRIVDTHTHQVVATGLTAKGASRSVDRRDIAYGAYRYRRECENPEVFATMPSQLDTAPTVTAE